ncbi:MULTISPECIES: hypothetical protein [Halobellus]|uniref:DUF7860 family protein n=1 Tax=Halobellus TaxID=1073986 RepID=UPI00210EF2DE|nr:MULTISPECIES: hypothetical protein [Halobellus]MDQ2055359.1 hypothetical protein [Halobellus sp. H-GB7]
MTGRYGNLDYPTLTKRSFLLGIGLFAVGALGEFAIATTGAAVPAWEHTLLVDAEFLGVLLALLSPFVFGILLPLTE